MGIKDSIDTTNYYFHADMGTLVPILAKIIVFGKGDGFVRYNETGNPVSFTEFPVFCLLL